MEWWNYLYLNEGMLRLLCFQFEAYTSLFRICYFGKQTLMDWSYVLIVDADGRSHYPWCVASLLHFRARVLNNL